MNKHILVILADHKKARFIHVDDIQHAFELEKLAFKCDVPDYSDKPGRAFESSGPTRYALTSPSDKKERLREEMGIQLKDHLKKIVKGGDYHQFYLFTEPKLEGSFKHHCPKALLKMMKKVIHKNVTNEKFDEAWGKIKDDILYEES